MFKKQGSAESFRKMWTCEPKIGHQVSYGKFLLEIKHIDGDDIFWEEVPWSEANESSTPTMIKDKVQRKKFIEKHILLQGVPKSQAKNK